VVTETHAFSYRAKANSQDIGVFERKAHNLISANRRFRQLLDEPVEQIGPQIRGLDSKSYCAQATLVGERAWRFLKLGDPPALKLREAIEAKWSIMVLFVDAPASISGAACHLPDGDFILINRTEASFRRNFNLGHELFHILTWSQMPPERIDPELEGDRKPKVEKLADAFTAGLLMPSEVVSERWKDRNLNEDTEESILNSAKELRVSGAAMYWRLVNMSLLSNKEQDSVNTQNLSRHDDEETAGRPNPLNANFVRRLHAVLQRGVVSTRKASELLDCDPEDLWTICAAYGHASPSEAPTPENNAAAQCKSLS